MLQVLIMRRFCLIHGISNSLISLFVLYFTHLLNFYAFLSIGLTNFQLFSSNSRYSPSLMNQFLEKFVQLIYFFIIFLIHSLYIVLTYRILMKPIKNSNGLGNSFSINLGLKFTNLGILGSGSYGEVYKVKHNETGNIYAIKYYKSIFTNRILALRTLREIMILRKINNNRIIKIYDIIPPPNLQNFQSLHVVLQYLPFDLKKICQKTVTLKDHHIPKILYQLLVGLKYLRHVHILHRDLKPENILSDNQFNIKICDFGLARPSVHEPSFTQVSKQAQEKGNQNVESNATGALTPEPAKTPSSSEPAKKYNKYNMTCHVVSRWYRAPQLILMQTKYDSSIQIWSVGCILGQLISEHEKNKKLDIAQKSERQLRRRRPLFQGKACFPMSPPKKSQQNLYKLQNGFPHSQDDQISKILQVIGSPTEQQVNFIEEELASNYIKSLPKYPKKKATQIFNYCKPEWQDFLDKTLLFDPRKRMSIDEALKHPLFDGIRNQSDYQFEDQQDFELFLPSEMPMEEIKEKLIKQILVYQNGVNMTDDEL